MDRVLAIGRQVYKLGINGAERTAPLLKRVWGLPLDKQLFVSGQSQRRKAVAFAVTPKTMVNNASLEFGPSAHAYTLYIG